MPSFVSYYLSPLLFYASFSLNRVPPFNVLSRAPNIELKEYKNIVASLRALNSGHETEREREREREERERERERERVGGGGGGAETKTQRAREYTGSERYSVYS